jgi:hypothetical protein
MLSTRHSKDCGDTRMAEDRVGREGAESARGDTGYCIAHGGGKRCQQEASPLRKAARTVTPMGAAGVASTWAAPRLLKEAARCTASRTAGASGVKRTAAPSQSLELPVQDAQPDGGLAVTARRVLFHR